MGAAIDRLRVRLAAVPVIRHPRIVGGKVQDVEAHTREIDLRAELLRSRSGRTSSYQRRPPTTARAKTKPEAKMEKVESLAKYQAIAKAKGAPIRTGDVVEAARLLGEGKHVELTSEDKVATLVKELKRLVDEAKAKGEEAPNYDLCKVTVKDTNLFCVENKGIPRVKMPQFSGVPVPGSKADTFPKNDKGEVNLSAEFAKFITTNDVTGDGVPEVIEDAKAKASHLKAAQNELVGANVAKIASSMDKTGIDPQYAWIWTSRDGYVIDGHHRWAAMVAHGLGKGEDVEIPIHQVDLDIISILDAATEWTKEMGIQPKKGS
jgi:hypothetical protein